MVIDVSIFCADVGSVERGNFGWYGLVSGERECSGKDLQSFRECILSITGRSRKIAIGFEFPTFVYITKQQNILLKERPEDIGKPWSAGAGPFALAAGIAEVCWLFRELRDALVDYRMLFSLDDFRVHEGQAILFWEAHVTTQGSGCNDEKGDAHVADARKAVRRFTEIYRTANIPRRSHNTIFNLLGACLWWAGLTDDPAVTSTKTLVVHAAK